MVTRTQVEFDREVVARRLEATRGSSNGDGVPVVCEQAPTALINHAVIVHTVVVELPTWRHGDTSAGALIDPKATHCSRCAHRSLRAHRSRDRDGDVF